MRLICIAILAACPLLAGHEFAVSGTRFLLDGKPFPYTGVSFFNAIYNAEFNRNPETQKVWMEKFQRYGITTFRIWSQWDSKGVFADSCAECTLYHPDGRLRAEHVAKLKQILTNADSLGMVVQLVLFSQESVSSGIKLAPEAQDRAVAALAVELKPWRNLSFQIWNEYDDRTLEMVKAIRQADPRRLLTNSPGFAAVLTGVRGEEEALDYLTPHTTRRKSGKNWEIAASELTYLQRRFGKPVVDDEPARNGTPKHGGPGEKTYPMDHIVQMIRVWQSGCYVTYHHDMFQLGYGDSSVPPLGIPDPEFSPYHRAVFEFLALRERYMPELQPR